MDRPRTDTVRGQPICALVADRLQGIAEGARLVGRHLHDEPPAALERHTHHDAAPLLGDLERAVARPWLHGRHAYLLEVSEALTCVAALAASATFSLIGGHTPNSGGQVTCVASRVEERWV